MYPFGCPHLLTAFSTIMASPRDTPPKKRWPASISSLDENWLAGAGCGGGGAGAMAGGGCGGIVCATASVTQNPADSAADTTPDSTAAKARLAKFIGSSPPGPGLTKRLIEAVESANGHESAQPLREL